jgi:putative endonuclease
MAAKDELGRAGEELAVAELERSGLIVLDRNWRCREGELDIVATDGHGTAVFCEVKTRRGVGYGTPLESVTPGKRRRLRRLAQLWLAGHRTPWVSTRFDVVGVLWPLGGDPVLDHRIEAF